MRCLDKFNKRMSYSGGSLRKEGIFSTRELLKSTFADDPSYALGVYFWRLGLKEYKNETPIGIRLYGRTYSSANGVTVKFQTPYDTPVVVGDIVYDIKEDQYFICTESFNIDDIHYKGKLTLCNWMLKWQNKDGRIFEYPCYDMNATQYNSGEQPGKVMTVETAQHLIWLPSDENTIELCSPQRFYLDKATINPTTYIITQNDTTSHNYGKKGLVKLTVFAHPSNSETDRLDLGICDYIDMSAGSSNAGTTVKDLQCRASKVVIKYNTSILKSGGDSQVFVGKFYDDKGNEITNIVPHWTIICDFEDKLQIEKFDNCLSIGIDDDAYIDEEFKLVCSSDNSGDGDDNLLSSTLLIKIESLL